MAERMSRMRGWAVGLSVVAGLWIAGQSSASVIPTVATNGTLQELIDLGTTGMVVGDKRFFDFSYDSDSVGASLPPMPIEIVVSPAPGADVGLEFSFGWFATGGSSMTSVINYTVEVLASSSLYIDKVGLLFNGLGVGGIARADESIFAIDNSLLGTLSVVHDGVGGLTDIASASLDLVPDRKSVKVSKSISVTSDGGFASISFVDNTFPQVPEPNMIGWLLAGTPLLLVRRRTT